MQEFNDLSQFKRGQVYLLGNPGRIGRIEGKDTVERLVDETREIVVEDAVKVKVTVVTEPIEGKIAPHLAKNNKKLLESAARAAREDGSAMDDGTFWYETWAVRTVPVVNITKGKAARLDDYRKRRQVYVHDSEGRSRRANSSSPVKNKPVMAEMIQDPGIFK